MKFYRLAFILSSLLMSCSPKEQSASSSEPYKIDLGEDAYYQSETPLTSTFFNSIEYVKLETSKKSKVKADYRVQVSKNYIYTIAYRQILQFNRKDGSFIKEISHFGNGALAATLPNVNWPDSDSPISLTNTHIVKINTENSRLELIAPRVSSVEDFAILEPELYASFVNDSEDKKKSYILLFTGDGTEVNRFYINQKNYDPDNLLLSLSNQGNYFHYRHSNTFFKQVYNDTLYSVTRDGMHPYAYFDLGEFAIEFGKEQPLSMKDIWDKIYIIHMFENQDYIFFNYQYKSSTYAGAFNKQTLATYLPESKSLNNGFNDDSTGFIDFVPWSMNEHNELISSLTPQQVLHWFNTNENLNLLSKSIRNLKSTKPNDNPVIAIAKLK